MGTVSPGGGGRLLPPAAKQQPQHQISQSPYSDWSDDGGAEVDPMYPLPAPQQQQRGGAASSPPGKGVVVAGNTGRILVQQGFGRRGLANHGMVGPNSARRGNELPRPGSRLGTG